MSEAAAVDATEPRGIEARLVAILAALPAIGKSSWNEQQKFHYRSHDDVLNALNPLLAEHGVVILPDVIERDVGERKTSNGKTMYEVSLHVRFSIVGIDGTALTASAWGEGTDMGDKATNKAMTAAFKAVLAQIFAISTGDTIDADGDTPEETVARGRRGASPAAGTIDPATALLPGAIDGEGFQARLAEALTAIDPTVDWASTLSPCVEAVFGVKARADIPKERVAEYWRRLSNAVARITTDHDVSGFPPLGSRPEGEAAIGAAFGWAFGGAIPTIIRTAEAVEAALDAEAREAAAVDDPPTAADDVPWVDDVLEALDKESREEATT